MKNTPNDPYASKPAAFSSKTKTAAAPAEGILFSIEEFAVFDGPGPRIGVFLKGCPLRCQWCHNPEGLEPSPQIIKNPNGCIHCGNCVRVCRHPDKCVLCQQCVLHCPGDLIRVSGERYTSDELAEKLLFYRPFMEQCGGGVTFSGGEILMQSRFLCEVIDRLEGMHVCIETSGFGSEKAFSEVLSRIDMAYYDLKIMDREKHRQYTGQYNDVILANARLLARSEVPYIIRVPLIRGVNCDEENMHRLCRFLTEGRLPLAVELLPYNRFAGAKYAMVGKTYAHEDFCPPEKEEMDQLKAIVRQYGIT